MQPLIQANWMYPLDINYDPITKVYVGVVQGYKNVWYYRFLYCCTLALLGNKYSSGFTLGP